jgi:hypothetical protein
MNGPHLSGAGFFILGHRQALDFTQKIVDAQESKRARIFLQNC